MRPQRLLSVLLALSTLVIAPAAAGSALGPFADLRSRPRRRDARDRRPLLPAVRQRRVRRAALRPRDQVRPRRRTTSAGSRRSRPGPRRTLSCFSLDLVGLTVSAITVNGDPATWSRTAPRADDHAGRAARLRRGPHGRRDLRGVPEGLRRSRASSGLRVHPDRRRGGRRGRTGGGDRVVPRQRPSRRPRLVHVRDHRAERLPGGRQRGARVGGRPRGTGRRTSGRRTTRWRATSRRSTSASGRCGPASRRAACR